MKKAGAKVLTAIGALLGIAMVFTSCASVHEVQVLYKAPAPSAVLRGKAVKFVLIDQRETKEFLRPGAKRELKHFSNNISFAVAKYNEPGFKIGPMPPLDAVKEAFKRRLEADGIVLATKVAPSVPELEIVLKDFSLDFYAHKWVASMSYKARLKINGHVRATQLISDRAERFRVLTRKGADMAVGDIFTDALNRLDLVGLFKNARLLKME